MTTITLSVDDTAGFDTANFFPSDLQLAGPQASRTNQDEGILAFNRYVDNVRDAETLYVLIMTGTEMAVDPLFIDVSGIANSFSFLKINSGVTTTLASASIELTDYWETVGGIRIPSLKGMSSDGLMNQISSFSTANFILNGNIGGDTLRGSFGDDVLRGGAGADRLIGGSGSDTASYEFSAAGVTVNLSKGTASGGDAAGDLLSTIENITGSSYADTLTGNDLANFIDGGLGFDRIDGGNGNDAIFGRDGGGVLEGGAGNDRVDGGEQNDTIYGGTGNDELRVGNGENSAYGEDGNDFLLGADGVDRLYGGAGADNLNGTNGDDILDGGAGADEMLSYNGAAKFYVDNSLDLIFDVYDGDGDTVLSAISYSLAEGAHIENFRTTSDVGTKSINLTGNVFAQTIAGNAGSNVLDGGGGMDRMAGYGGNDTYVVDSTDDLVFEDAGKGTDTIRTSVSYTLRTGLSVEELRTTADAGTVAINLTGNSADNRIAGNAGTNILDGGSGGTDVLAGYGGNDKYYVNSAGDLVYESAGKGTDIVYASASWTLGGGSSVEEIRTTNDAGTKAIDLRGNDLTNRLAGNAGVNLLSGFAGNDTLASYGGADRLVGGLGADTLYGGSGNDLFVFDAATESGITSTTRDQIMDFAAGDRIDVSNIDAKAASAFAGNQAFVLDTNSSFSIGEIRQTVVSGNLVLEFNTDADSAAEMSILLVTQGPLVSADFVL